MGGPFELQKNPNGSLEEACGGAVAPPFLGSQGKGETDKKGKLKATIFFRNIHNKEIKTGKTPTCKQSNTSTETEASEEHVFSMCRELNK